MQVDPEVNRRKYDRELTLLQDKRTMLEDRGIFLLGSSRFPTIDLVFVPRHPLRIAVPPPPGVPLPPGAMAVAELPTLSARAFKAHFDLSDYNLQPPSLQFRDCWTDKILPFEQMFRAIEYEAERKAHVVLIDDHPLTHRPFLCLRGIREYHDHPQHTGDEWLLYKDKMNMFSIVMSLWRVSLDIPHPQIMPHPNGIQVLFVPEEKH